MVRAPGDHPAPRVSVVVPTHNRPRLVLEAVRSIVRQEHDGAIEVLVVFDNSEPHPIPVDCPPGRTVRTLVNDQRTPGLAGARNTGILAAEGDYIAFCDDDDAWLPGKLASQMAVLGNRGRDAVVASTGIVVVSGDRRHPRPGPAATLMFRDFLRDRVMEIHPSTLLFPRKTLTEDIGLVDEKVPHSYGEDYELLLRTSRVSPVVNVPQPLVRVAFHSGSFYASRWQAIIDGLEYILAMYPEFEDVPEGHARIRGQIAFAQAALGDRVAARRSAREVVKLNRSEKRAYAALLVASGFPARWVSTLARLRGRGI